MFGFPFTDTGQTDRVQGDMDSFKSLHDFSYTYTTSGFELKFFKSHLPFCWKIVGVTPWKLPIFLSLIHVIQVRQNNPT
jgi:hypothetical protein